MEVNITKLYPLEPIGLGTPFVECLSSYVSRLAEMHNVSVSDLMLKVIFPKTNKDYIINSNGRTLYRFSRIMDGSSEAAKEAVAIIEELTGINNLRFLTMQNWNNVVSSRALYKKSQAWCPLCYEERYTKKLPLYRPLLWNFETITLCPIHKVELVDRCPNCMKQIPFLDYRTRNGFCSRCKSWLGELKFVEKQNSRDLEWYEWVVSNIGELILCDYSKENYFIHNLKSYINTFKENSAGLSEGLCIAKSTVNGWLKGRLPKLENMLRFSFYSQCRLIDLIKNNVKYSRQVKRHPIFSTAKRNKIDKSDLKKNMIKEIQSEVPSINSIADFSRKLKVSIPVIKKYCPDEYLLLYKKMEKLKRYKGRII